MKIVITSCYSNNTFVNLKQQLLKSEMKNSCKTSMLKSGIATPFAWRRKGLYKTYIFQLVVLSKLGKNTSISYLCYNHNDIHNNDNYIHNTKMEYLTATSIMMYGRTGLVYVCPQTLK